MLLGAGRATKEDKIDLAVGIKLFKRVGDPVKKGEPLAELYINREDSAETAEMMRRTAAAFTIASAPAEKLKLIYAVVTKNGIRKL